MQDSRTLILFERSLLDVRHGESVLWRIGREKGSSTRLHQGYSESLRNYGGAASAQGEEEEVEVEEDDLVTFTNHLSPITFTLPGIARGGT